MSRQSAASLAFLSGAPPLARLTPPLELAGEERIAFLDIVTACPASHFQPQDVFLLSAYARAIALERRASAELAAGGHVCPHNGRASPWLAVLAHATKSMIALSYRLRVSPQGRSPTNPKRPTPVSYYERAALEDVSRDADPD